MTDPEAQEIITRIQQRQTLDEWDILAWLDTLRPLDHATAHTNLIEATKSKRWLTPSDAGTNNQNWETAWTIAAPHTSNLDDPPPTFDDPRTNQAFRVLRSFDGRQTPKSKIKWLFKEAYESAKPTEQPLLEAQSETTKLPELKSEAEETEARHSEIAAARQRIANAPNHPTLT